MRLQRAGKHCDKGGRAVGEGDWELRLDALPCLRSLLGLGSTRVVCVHPAF